MCKKQQVNQTRLELLLLVFSALGELSLLIVFCASSVLPWSCLCTEQQLISIFSSDSDECFQECLRFPSSLGVHTQSIGILKCICENSQRGRCLKVSMLSCIPWILTWTIYPQQSFRNDTTFWKDCTFTKTIRNYTFLTRCSAARSLLSRYKYTFLCVLMHLWCVCGE